MERNMNREVETIREKVHTTADAALFLCFQEVKGSHSKGVIRLPLLHYDIPFEGYGEMLLRMNRIYDLLGMPDAGSCMRSLSEGEKEEWEFTDEMKNNQDTTLPAGTERMVSIQIQFRQHCSLQGFLICGKQKAGFRSALEICRNRITEYGRKTQQNESGSYEGRKKDQKENKN